MSKAILVMDMPKSCTKCNFIYREMCCCGLLLIQTAAIESTEGYTKCRPSWCPLKEVPEKKDRDFVKEDYNGGYCHGMVHGWNACIDEILGKDDE